MTASSHNQNDNKVQDLIVLLKDCAKHLETTASYSPILYQTLSALHEHAGHQIALLQDQYLLSSKLKPQQHAEKSSDASPEKIQQQEEEDKTIPKVPSHEELPDSSKEEQEKQEKQEQPQVAEPTAAKASIPFVPDESEPLTSEVYKQDETTSIVALQDATSRTKQSAERANPPDSPEGRKTSVEVVLVEDDADDDDDNIPEDEKLEDEPPSIAISEVTPPSPQEDSSKIEAATAVSQNETAALNDEEENTTPDTTTTTSTPLEDSSNSKEGGDDPVPVADGPVAASAAPESSPQEEEAALVTENDNGTRKTAEDNLEPGAPAEADNSAKEGEEGNSSDVDDPDIVEYSSEEGYESSGEESDEEQDPVFEDNDTEEDDEALLARVPGLGALFDKIDNHHERVSVQLSENQDVLDRRGSF